MDQPNAAEFASQRYFDKLRQNEARDQPQTAQSQPQRHTHDEPGTFILPIGRPRSPEHAPNDLALKDRRRGHFSFRSILPSRTSAEHESRRLSTDSSKQSRVSFDQLFLALPNELKIHIIASLPLSDVLGLRLVSRSWHALISFNEFTITRHHIRHHIPAYATRLYPAPDRSAVKLHYLCGIWHRLHVAAKLSFLISERVTTEIFLRNDEVSRRQFAPQYERMRRRLIPLLFTIFHFFETTRRLRLEYIQEHGHGLLQEPYTANPIELKAMSMYDDQTLLAVHQVFPLVISSFCRRLRPPSYAGSFERSLRGYLKHQPADEIYVAAMCVGGLRQMEKFWEIKGYNSRRAVVDHWYHSITREAAETNTKSRRGFMGLSRKKSSMHMADPSKGHEQTAHHRFRRASDTSRATVDTAAAPAPRDNLVFETSLAAGMPMGDLSVEQLRALVPDLPLLRDIWAPAAEALILQRRIVERPVDIKRNAAVLLDLIREDGAAEEDEWWYGHGAPESVRPPLEAIKEDPID